MQTDTNGVQKRKAVYGKTQAEVVAELAKIRDGKTKGRRLVTDERLTLGDYLKDWNEKVRPGLALAQSTLENYEYMIRHAINDQALSRKRLVNVHPDDLAAFMVRLSKSGKSQSTCRNALMTLSKALRGAVRNGRIASNPVQLMEAAEKPSAKRVDPKRVPTPREALQVLDAVKGHELETFTRVLLGTGLRRGEVLSLRWADIDADKNRITVAGSVQRLKSDGVVLSDHTKTEAGMRTISVPPDVMEALESHRKSQNVIAPMVFTTDRYHAGTKQVRAGQLVDPNWVTRTFKRLCLDAGLPGYTPHDFRHAVATMMRAQRAPLDVIGDHLGHSSYSVTKDVYAHLTDEVRDDAARFVAAGYDSAVAASV